MSSRTSLAILPRLEVLASHQRTQRTNKKMENRMGERSSAREPTEEWPERE
ncbi:hypothetical protein Syun_003538 [Stephania yunnanensis]|uniref:Uncharacterized protein n=1 Tax=Stephania yunnanensis TaxID=152371 RepID=A0AAP0L1H0_9MAGN